MEGLPKLHQNSTKAKFPGGRLGNQDNGKRTKVAGNGYTGNGYIYVPITTPKNKSKSGLLDFASVWIDGRKEKGKDAYTIIQGPFLKNAEPKGRLAGLTANDKLYILGHGRLEGSDFIGGTVKHKRPWKSDTILKLTPAQLADNLHKEGLTRDFIHLRVFSCGSANRHPDFNNNMPFAAALKAAMQALGYNNLRVTGYTGLTHTNYGSYGGGIPCDYSSRKSVSMERQTGEFPPPHIVASQNKIVF